jgi:hypothetical protein
MPAPPTVAVPSTPVDFPLRVSDNHRYLVDRAGRPFLMQGDSPWDLVVTPTMAEAVQYLDSRKARGFNTLLVEVTDPHDWPNAPRKAPNTIDGIAPFTKANDFGTPNDAYFDHAHAVIAAARARGMMVLLAPAYMGYSGTDEGWWNQMNKMPASSCTAFGDYLGRKFADLDNIVWVHGVDMIPPPGSPGEACGLAILHALQAKLPNAIHTGHWNNGGPDDGSLDEPAFAPFMQLNAVYTYGFIYQKCTSETARTPPLPTFVIETLYEGEHETKPFELRRQAYWADLTCTAGQLIGNLPVWSFARGWKAALDSTGANDMARLYAAFAPRRWYDLVPDGGHKIVTAGYGNFGGADYVAAGATPDGKLAMAYVPSTGTGTRSIKVDLSRFAGPVTAQWINPTRDGTVAAGGCPCSGKEQHEFVTPGDNGSGQNDWLLVVDSK